MQPPGVSEAKAGRLLVKGKAFAHRRKSKGQGRCKPHDGAEGDGGRLASIHQSDFFMENALILSQTARQFFFARFWARMDQGNP